MTEEMVRVLVIDDEIMLRETIADFLEDIDMEAETAADGAEGLEKFNSFNPDVLLVDLNMPVLDGFEVLAQVTKDSPDTPIIVISGVGVIQDAIRAVRLGAWDFLTKPINDLAILEHALNKALERARLIKENKRYQEHLEDEVEARTAELRQEIAERKRAQEELNTLNEELEQRVAKRTEELRDANQALTESIDQLKATQDQLVQSEKMASLGQLVAGVAHEINTPIGISVTAGSFLEEKTAEVQRLHQNGELTRTKFEKFLGLAGESSLAITANLHRAAELIQSFKQVAVDQTSQERRVFELAKYLDELLLSLRPKIKGTTHKVVVQCEPDVELNSYPGALTQVLTNLIMNSLIHGFEQMENGQMRIEARADGDQLELVYSDDGLGMPPERVSKIFDPFYTTKRGKGGTGLGMHIVYNLVAQSLGGSIVCDSEPGRGTSFTIRIPLRAE